jgi:hypothetical protein
MALALDVQLPRYAAPPRGDGRATLWIASDYAPRLAQSWPVLVPIPTGFHEVSEQEALAILKGVPTTLSFRIVAPADDAASVVAALSTAEPDAAVVAKRRPSRAPREPRAPRAPRTPRAPRAMRLAAPARAPRRPRPPRPPRPPRVPRVPRARRPRNYKTTQRPGLCKGPSCTCWTPGGCVGEWYADLLPWFKDSGCFRGPCYDYEACVSGKCQYHPGCVVNQVIQFWARQYRAAVTWTGQAVAPVLTQARRRLLGATGVAGAGGAAEEPAAAGAPGITLGCPAGQYWTIGLTGCRCVPAGSGLPAATVAQVIGCIGQAEWDRLVGLGVQGTTA